jgi:hypothetical protein
MDTAHKITVRDPLITTTNESKTDLKNEELDVVCGGLTPRKAGEDQRDW